MYDRFMKDRRCKVLRIDEDDMLDVLCNRMALDLANLPADARFMHAHYAYGCKAFDIIVWSASYPDVSIGCELTRIEPDAKLYECRGADGKVQLMRDQREGEFGRRVFPVKDGASCES